MGDMEPYTDGEPTKSARRRVAYYFDADIGTYVRQTR